MQLFQINDNEFSNNDYLLQLRRRYSWNHFRRSAKVLQGTYSEILVKRIYSSAFVYSINLLQEYKKYYGKEYRNLNRFLFWRYGISEEILDKLGDFASSYVTIFNFNWNINDDEILKDTIIGLFKATDGIK